MSKIDLNPVADLIARREMLLFAGAGLGIECNLPSWKSALLELADIIDSRDPAIAAGIRDRTSEALHLDAAQLFQMSKLLPREKIDALVKVFGKSFTVTSRARRLLRLPFNAYVTTNYDTIIEETIAEIFSKSLPVFRNTPEDFRAAAFRKEQYVIHIHGIITIPESIVLSRDDYKKLTRIDRKLLATDTDYDVFLRDLFRKSSLLFLGFSFDDPAFQSFLEYVERYLTLLCTLPSFAFLPESQSAKFPRLREANIAPIPYTDHASLWRLIEEMTDLAKGLLEKYVAPAPDLLEKEERELVTRVMAAIYAHLRTVQSPADSVADSVYAGLTRGVLEELSGKGGKSSVAEVAGRLARVLRIPHQKSEVFAKRGLGALALANVIAWDRDRDEISIKEPTEDLLRNSIGFLVSRLRDRASVRYHRELPDDPCIREYILRILVANGMSIAHSIIRKHPIEEIALHKLLDVIYCDVFPKGDDAYKASLTRAIHSLLTSPTPDEAEVLSKIARVAFMTDVILNEPTLESITRTTSVDSIWLDANIVIPALLQHHPRHSIYSSTLRSSVDNGARLAIDINFLKEIISHRNLALNAYREGGFSNQKGKFERYILLWGSSGVNAFLGAYASWGAAGNTGDFLDFLEMEAPYTSVEALSNYLGKLGYIISDLQVDPRLEVGRIARWEAGLRDQYRDMGSEKHRILTYHEARQLEVLLIAWESEKPAWFVTADKRFVEAVRRLVQPPRPLLPDYVIQLLLSPAQYAHYVALSSTRPIDWSGYAQLIWSPSYQNLLDRFIDHIIDRVLSEYEVALTMSIPQIVSAVQSAIEADPAEMNWEEARTGSEIARLKSFQLLEGFESKFYEIMAEEKRKKGLQ